MILQEIKQKLNVPRNTILQLVDMGKIVKIGNQYEIVDEEYFKDFTLENHRKMIREARNLKISQKVKAKYASLSEEEKLERNNRISKATKSAMHKPEVYEKVCNTNRLNRQKTSESVKSNWDNMTNEQYIARCNSIKLGLANMPNYKKSLMITSMRESLKLLYSDKDYLENHRKRVKDGMTEEVCEKISVNTKIAMNNPEVLEKIVATKKLHGTINTSKPAKLSADLASKLFDIIELEKAYPGDDNHYHCDMYVKDIDLWIELNFTWTHGYRPYDETDEWCKEQLARWQEKAKTSDYYKKAISIWTYDDINRQKIAKKNNMNWIAFYTYEEFEQWLNSLT